MFSLIQFCYYTQRSKRIYQPQFRDTFTPLCSSSPRSPTNSQDVKQEQHFKWSKIPCISSPIGSLQERRWRWAVHWQCVEGHGLRGRQSCSDHWDKRTHRARPNQRGRGRRAARTTDGWLADDLGPTAHRGRTGPRTSKLNLSRFFVITQSWQCCQERLAYGSKNVTCSGDWTWDLLWSTLILLFPT